MIPKPVSIERYESVEHSDIPHGTYKGTWGGYVIKFKAEGKSYRIQTDIGIKTPVAPCRVVVDGEGVRIER